MTVSAKEWTPQSWTNRSAAQSPRWPDADALVAVQQRLAQQPPLVFAGEARRLTTQLGEVAHGRAFLLQAGDCAESFDGGSADSRIAASWLGVLCSGVLRRSSRGRR